MKSQATGDDSSAVFGGRWDRAQHWGMRRVGPHAQPGARGPRPHPRSRAYQFWAPQLKFCFSGRVPTPFLLLPLPVTWNFSPAFYSQLFFSSNLRESRCRSAGRPSVLCGLTGSRDPTSFFLVPIHNFFYFVLGTLFFINPFSNFFFNLYKFNVCVGFGWAVEIDLRVNHFSLFLPSPLEWFVGPGPFFHWRRIRLSMEEVSISNWWSSTAQMT